MLNIVFAATPKLACPSLEALWELSKQGYINISAILTRPDQPAGRKRVLQPSAIKACALELGIENILVPEKLHAVLRQQITALRPDILVVFAYGKIFRQVFLDLFPLGGINMHPSALPQWRGPSPIEAQLLAGANELAISIQKISLEMDAGDILVQDSYPLPSKANYFVAEKIVAEHGAALLQNCCKEIALRRQDYLDTAKPQEHESASYCSMICKDDGRLDWRQSAWELSRKCCAYVAWPKAHSWLVLGSKENNTIQNLPNSPKYPGRCDVLRVNILDAEVWQENEPNPSTEYSQFQEWLQQTQIAPGSLLALHPTAGLLVLTGCGILSVKELQRESKKACSAQEFANQLPKDTYILPKYKQNSRQNPWEFLPAKKLYRFEMVY